MEQFDPREEREVWQRVQGGREGPAERSFGALELAAMELAGYWRQLEGQLTGRQRELARKLYQGEQENLAVLRGLGVLAGSGTEVLKRWPPRRDPPGRLLEAGYHRTRRAMAEYMARSAESTFGPVFRILAQREEAQLERIARLMGLQ